MSVQIDSYRRRDHNSGYLLLSILIAIVFFSIIIINILPTLNFLLSRGRRIQDDDRATNLLQEGQEVAYHVCQHNWGLCSLGSFSTAVVFDDVGNPSWTLVPYTPDVIEAKYNRRIEIEQVCRNTEADRVECALGTADPTSKLVRTTITWDSPASPISAEILMIELLAE